MYKLKQITSIIISAVLLMTLSPSGTASAGNILLAYPGYDERITRNYEYEVTVTQGDKTIPLTVYDRGNSSTLLGARTLRPDMHRRFCEFAFSGDAVTVNIRVKKDFDSFSVIPGAKNYPVSYANGVISVTVSQPDECFALRLDGDDTTVLSVFADSPEGGGYIGSGDSVLVIDSPLTEMNNGEYLTVDGKTSFTKSTANGKTLLTPVSDAQHPVTSVYIAPGCVLNARVRAAAPGVRIYGHGIILDPYSDIFETDIRSAEDSFFMLVEYPDCSVRDVKLIDSQNYSLTLGWQCDRTEIENVKILASTMCTDGISVFESQNIKAKGNYIYPGDNAVVFGGNCGGSVFENNIIGSTCAAFFPQSSIQGTVTFRDSYVFRCDEGCVNNWYGASGDGSAIDGIVFDGLDCADVITLPWLLCSYNQGTPQKNFTFKNVSITAPRGTPYITEPSDGNAVIIGAENEEYPSSGYNIGFENLFVDGNPVRSQAQLGCSIPGGAAQLSFTVSDGGGFNPAPFRYNADYIFPYKIFIGGSETFLSYCPAYYEGGILLPAEILQKLGTVEKSGIVIIDGKRFINLNNLSAYGALAEYDSASGVIHIEKPAYRSDNLLTDNAAFFSRWTEMTCYETDLSAYTDGGKTVYRVDVPSKYSRAGMKRFITDEIKRNGSSVYKLTFSAKTAGGTNQKAFVVLACAPSEYGYIEKTLSLTDKWNTYSFTFDLTGADTAGMTDIYLAIGNNGTADFSAVFKDFILTDENAPEKPAPCDHKHSVNKPSCTASAVCSICGETIPATGHADNNGDGRCDKCGAVSGTVCNHICHSENGFLKFIWNIAKIFCRLFGIKQYCKCGTAHY